MLSGWYCRINVEGALRRAIHAVSFACQAFFADPALGKCRSLLLKGGGAARAHVMNHEPTGSSGEEAGAAALRLPLHLEVVLDREADRKFVRLMHGGAIRRELAFFWMRNLFGYAGLVLGIYCALSSERGLTACMIGTLGLWLFMQHRVVATAMAESRMSVVEPVRVKVVISEEGVAETRDGIEVRFGWSAMQEWLLEEDILCIRVTTNAWAWLPGKGMEPALRLEDLAGLLMSRGVPERRLKAVAAKSGS